MTIKKSDKVKIVFIRPGATQSGKDERFLGEKDEPLLPREIIRINKRKNSKVYPEVSRVYSSSLQRCRESAYIIYSDIPILLVNGFEAFHYGEFQGKTYEELVGDPKYMEDIFAKDLLPIPGGESPYVFHARVYSGFKDLVEEVRQTSVRKIGVITHKNVILSILRRIAAPRSAPKLPPIDYGGGVVLEYNYDTKSGIIINSF